MRIKRFLLILFATTSAFVSAQNKIQGYILDKQTNKPISYTIVSELKQKYGCYSDTTGLFTLFYLSDTDSLKVSNLGYNSLFISIRDLQKNPQLLLEASPVQLSEVVINPNSKKLKEIEIGFFSRKTNIVMATVYPLNLQAFFIPSIDGKGIYMIKSIKFIYEVTSGSANSPLRVRLLEANSKGEPGADLITENVVFKKLKSGKKHVADIDISKSRIFMPQNGVFVALEWIMDKSLQRTNMKEGIPGPYLGEVKTDNAFSKWSNTLNSNKWIKVQSKNIPSIGLTIIDYSK
jgi:hypothetical protein